MAHLELSENFGGFTKLGVPFLGVPVYNETYSILGSMLGSPYLGKLSFKG